MRLRNEKIKYYGEIKDENNYLKIVRASDILLMPSLAEDFPTVVIEAMSQGLTVLANCVGAVSSVVNNDNGWIVSPDFEKFKSAMIKIINAPSIEVDLKKKKCLKTIEEDFFLGCKC